MLIKVWNKETTLVETIKSSDLDKTKHYNRNTHEEFAKADLENFTKKGIT